MDKERYDRAVKIVRIYKKLSPYYGLAQAEELLDTIAIMAKEIQHLENTEFQREQIFLQNSKFAELGRLVASQSNTCYFDYSYQDKGCCSGVRCSLTELNICRLRDELKGAEQGE